MIETPTASSLSSTPPASTKSDYNVALGYLRAFVVVLVVAHHAALAYHPFAPPAPALLVSQPRWWQAFPVVDSQRSSVFALLVGFNDVFFMSLMFMLSGLFVWGSLERKGAGTFVRGRLRRLGLPFVLAAGLLAPLAYYPSYLETTARLHSPSFWSQWLSLSSWPSGPAWFLWVLSVFDCAAAALFLLAPNWVEALRRIVARSGRRPLALFALLVAVSAIVYIPMSLAFPFQWSAFGPFTFQTSRIFHYFVYFLIAVALGAQPTVEGLLSPGSKLTRRWALWALGALFAFALVSAASIAAVKSHQGSELWAAFAGFGFALSCAASCFALLALFLRFVNTRVRLFDSLSDNSYGIYLVHYAIVSWLQYTLLTAALPAIAKGAVVLFGALALSWITTAALRRIPHVAQVI